MSWMSVRINFGITGVGHLRSPSICSGVRVTRFLVLYVCFDRSLFVLLYFFFWSLCCLFFFDMRILITPLVSSNSSFITTNLNTDSRFHCTTYMCNISSLLQSVLFHAGVDIRLIFSNALSLSLSLSLSLFRVTKCFHGSGAEL